MHVNPKRLVVAVLRQLALLESKRHQLLLVVLRQLARLELKRQVQRLLVVVLRHCPLAVLPSDLLLPHPGRSQQLARSLQRLVQSTSP